MSYSLEFGAGAWACALAALAGAAFAWHARQSPAPRGLLVLRGLAVLGLVLALLKPALAHKKPLLQKPKLGVLIDSSHSMEGRAGRQSRLEAASEWLRKNRSRLEGRADPAFFSVAARGRRLAGFSELGGLRPESAAFNPEGALRDVAEDPALSPAPQRFWLLSDGNAEPGPDVDSAVASLKAPLDVLAVGPSRRGRSLSFSDLKTPDFAFLHGRFTVRATVEASDLAGQRLRLKLLRERPGPQKAWDAVEEQVVAVASDYETIGASFTATAQALGSERYRLEASREGAPVKEARAREFHVEVIRQKYRIMYLSGRPSAEYAQLREFLKADPNFELVSFVILRNPENPVFTPDNELSLIPFPAEEIFVQSLSQFDLFILENFSYVRFRLPAVYLESLKRFVSAGGGLLVIGGENAFGLGGYRGTALEEMLPVALANTAPDFAPGLFSAKPVALSHPLVNLYDTPEASKAAWEALPPLDGYGRFSAARPGATILAVHPQEKTGSGEPLPVFAIRDYGRGKVMLASSDSTWRWKLGAAADWRAGGFYGRFWSKAVQYLTGSLDLSKVKFAPLPDRLPPREPAVFSLRVFDEGFKPAERALAEVSAFWTPPDGRVRELIPQEVEPGVFSIELTGLSVGAHRLRASVKYRGRPWGEDQVRFQWEAPSAEAPIDRRWLKKAAEAGGGALSDISSADLDSLLNKLPPVRAEAEISERYYPWASPLWLWLTAALFLLEWALRRWKGHA